jgi:hypothetical protein
MKALTGRRRPQSQLHRTKPLSVSVSRSPTNSSPASSSASLRSTTSTRRSIGDVNDLVTDLSGKVIGALIGVDGFLGIGEKNVAVRFEDLKFTRDENSNVKVALDISRETLVSAPAYKTLEEKPVVEGSAKSDSGDKTKTY